MHIAFDVIYCVKMTLRMHLINVNGRFFLQNFRKKTSNIRNIYIVVFMYFSIQINCQELPSTYFFKCIVCSWYRVVQGKL